MSQISSKEDVKQVELPGAMRVEKGFYFTLPIMATDYERIKK